MSDDRNDNNATMRTSCTLDYGPLSDQYRSMCLEMGGQLFVIDKKTKSCDQFDLDTLTIIQVLHIYRIECLLLFWYQLSTQCRGGREHCYSRELADDVVHQQRSLYVCVQDPNRCPYYGYQYRCNNYVHVDIHCGIGRISFLHLNDIFFIHVTLSINSNT
jgi:hypothetical protein